jgi:hypothetical protein
MNDPDWTAPEHGHDFRDDTILAAATWFKSFVNPAAMADRLERARLRLLLARDAWKAGETLEEFDRSDSAAWWIFQAETYAVDRRYWVPEWTNLVAPIMTRFGQHLDVLQSIEGAEARAGRLMNAEKGQPEGGFFELLVALTYRLEGWPDVRFRPETPGLARTYDIDVSRPHRRWAVECKTVAISQYELAERRRAEELAKPAHAAALSATRSVVMEVIFSEELTHVPDDYLSRRVENFIADPRKVVWRDETSMGRIRNIDWRLCRRVMRKDHVYYGGSRMIELLVGEYRHQFNHSMVGKWRQAPEMPLYADAVYQASVISWANENQQSIGRKARHFRSIVGRANGQLPADKPGVVHIGVVSRAGMAVDSRRQFENHLEAMDFDPRPSHLRWVYENILAPELTTNRNESWAINDTTVPHKIGRHKTPEPLPGHVLLTPTNEKRPGVHWDGRGKR